MRPLLVIFNTHFDDQVCKAFLPWWRQSACDLLCSSPLDSQSNLEGIQHLHMGNAIVHAVRGTWWNLQSRMLDTMKFVHDHTDYDQFYFTQYDAVTLDSLPRLASLDDCVAHCGGGKAAPFESSFFLHPPWCFGRRALEIFLNESANHNIRTCETGIADRWLSLVVERAGIKWTPCNWSWSANAIDTDALFDDAVKAIKNGIVHVHGVKNATVLNKLLSAAKVPDS